MPHGNNERMVEGNLESNYIAVDPEHNHGENSAANDIQVVSLLRRSHAPTKYSLASKCKIHLTHPAVSAHAVVEEAN